MLDPPVLYSDHHDGDGQALFDAAGRLNYEGIVSKRVDAPYRSDRVEAWQKIKTVQREKFPVIKATIGQFFPVWRRHDAGSHRIGVRPAVERPFSCSARHQGGRHAQCGCDLRQNCSHPAFYRRSIHRSRSRPDVAEFLGDRNQCNCRRTDPHRRAFESGPG